LEYSRINYGHFGHAQKGKIKYTFPYAIILQSLKKNRFVGGFWNPTKFVNLDTVILPNSFSHMSFFLGLNVSLTTLKMINEKYFLQ